MVGEVFLGGELVLDVRWERGLWCWTLRFQHDDGRIEHVAFGRNLRRRKAEEAGESWKRVWLRQQGWWGLHEHE